MILEFSGVYGWGSEGNRDADFIAAMKAAALEVLSAEAVVFDLRKFRYEWGNRIWNVLACHRPDGGDALPAVLVISDECRKGFVSCAGMVPPMFVSLEEALRFVEGFARASVEELMRGAE